MRKFKFRLQKLMDAKAGEEKLRQRELGMEQHRLSQEEEKLKSLSDALEQTDENLREKLSGQVKAGELMIHHQWQRSLKTKINVQTQEVRKQDRVVEEARDRLVETSRDKKVLENLREKRFTEHQHQVNTETQNQLDDIGGNRHQRANGASEGK